MSARESGRTSAAAAPRVVRGACPHDCPDTCALEVTVESGRAVAIRGARDHPATGGTLCTNAIAVTAM